MEKELSLNTSVPKTIDGRDFNVTRVIVKSAALVPIDDLVDSCDDVLPSRDGLKGVCLLRIEHQRVYGYFQKGMYVDNDCWLDLDGEIMVQPDNIKGVVINGRGKPREITREITESLPVPTRRRDDICEMFRPTEEPRMSEYTRPTRPLNVGPKRDLHYLMSKAKLNEKPKC